MDEERVTPYTPQAAQRGHMTQVVKAVLVGSVLVFVMTVLTFIIIAPAAAVLHLSFASIYPYEYIFLSLCLGPLVGTFISTRLIDTESVPLASITGGIAASLPFIIFVLVFANGPYVVIYSVGFMIETVVFVVSGAIGEAFGKYTRDRKRLKTRATQ